ncbi:membrane protein [Streptomyces canus]|uniref:membrane protein n=1 Tax=Streptomyces canus TaxID=58343 RepID=UPI00039AD741|nr:membrane protein [Streptomyces canus]
MARGDSALLVGGNRRTPPVASDRARRVRGHWPSAAVAAAFTLAQLVLVRPGMGLGWDETVYVSQVGAQAPAAFFSAPRARGVSLLVAPIASWSTSTELLRVYLAVLSGLGLHLALRAWRGLFPARVLAVGGALFASLWITLFYGPQAMPNYWVAVGGLAAVGCFLRARENPRALWGVVAGAALMAWMRPTDAVWVTLPLLVASAVRRRPRFALALVSGLVAGGAQWVIEAYVSYGGLVERLHEGSRIQGGLGPQFAVDDQLRSLAGRALCRPCTGPLPDPAVMAWWAVLPLLAAVGLVVAVRAGRTRASLVPLACAATAAVPYLFLIGYAAPRFLLPAYALLAIPVADALFHLATTPAGRWRPVAAVLLAIGLTGHLAVQFAVLERTVNRTTGHHRDWARTAAELHRLGVRPPCLLTGHLSVPVAYYAGCTSAAARGPNTNSSESGIVGASRRMPVGVLTRHGGAPPAYARDWPTVPAAGMDLHVAPNVSAHGPG